MTIRTRNRLLVIGVTLLIAGIVALFTVFGGDKKSETTPAPLSKKVDEFVPTGTVDAPASPSGLEPDLVEPEPIVDGKTASLQMAELFAERYGSYSNQGSYRNLRDLLPVMTSAYRSRTEDFLDSVADSAPAVTYEGYTATKVASKEVSFDDGAGTALYEVGLQQVKTVGTGSQEILYPTLRVKLKKIGEDWRIDSAEWVR